MSRQIQSLLVKSARIQRAIDAEHDRRSVDWIRLLRLKLLRLKAMNRIECIAAAARERSLSAARPEPAFAGTPLRRRRRAA